MSITNPLPKSHEPAWEISRLFPLQGEWTEEDYLSLPGNHPVELDQGNVEVLAMPSEIHQSLVMFLYEVLVAFVRKHKLGKVLVAPFPVKLWEGKMREPDVLFMRHEHYDQRHDNYWIGADLVMEVVSPNDRNRDKVTKRLEYALAGIPEYWLIDPTDRTVTVFVLPEQSKEYRVAMAYSTKGKAQSVTLEGFAVELKQLFAELELGEQNN